MSRRRGAVSVRRGAVALVGGLLVLLLPFPSSEGRAEDVDPRAAAPAGGESTREAARVLIGTGRVDITPDHPIRLNGFGGRRDETSAVTQRIWAKALAIGGDERGPLVLVAIDSLGVRLDLVEEVARRLATKRGVTRERFALTFSHSHTTPMVAGTCPTIFSTPIPPEHQAHIDRYTRDLTDAVERAALAALDDRRPGRLSWGSGRVGFAMNRRTTGGPVDHELPVLLARGSDGEPRAVWTSYACHCVTLSHNEVSGDWAGYAQEAIERELPGAVALVSIGCGSDANPSSGVTGARVDVAEEQGEEIGREVLRLVRSGLDALPAPTTARLEHIDLALREPPSRERLEELVRAGGPAGYNASWQLAKLARGEDLLRSIRYPIQSWTFAEDLAVVFLAGEVCVDYALRLDRELDRSRLWVNGYSNDFCAYIPSERLLREGGYGGGAETVYFGLPERLAPGLEDRIVATVRGQLPAAFEPSPGTDGVPARSPAATLRSFRAPPGFRVELVACEPLVVDPVAVDFGPDGAVWVVEMHDYPSSVDGSYAKPGGRVKRLVDSDSDGLPDRATVFLDDLPFPTGVTAWGRGVLVCAAPDILRAEDTDGDGVADLRETLFTGFATTNYQARVNSLRLGLDGWIHGANGLIGGLVRLPDGREVDIGGRDFRMRPRSGELEPVAGLTQQGLARDDFDAWFGCDNGTLIRHYPLADHVVARNPHVAPPPPAAAVARDAESVRLDPVGELVTFALSGPTGRPTAACGLTIYRDDVLGVDLRGDSFTCEPVHQIVQRLELEPDGATFRSSRPEAERDRAFLASDDKWFRPVEARTAPDGSLWIVDMCRYVIEHPRWIPPETLARLDVRAGDDRGRIWRVVPEARPLRAVPRLDRLDGAELVAHLDTPNGTVRDLVHQRLLGVPSDPAVVEALRTLAVGGRDAGGRAQALAILDALDGLDRPTLERAMRDGHAGVRALAVRSTEGRRPPLFGLEALVAAAADDPDGRVRLAAAAALREAPSSAAVPALAHRIASEPDPWVLGAVFSSAPPHLAPLIEQVAAGSLELGSWRPLVDTAVALRDEAALGALLESVTSAAPSVEVYRVVGALLDACERDGASLRSLRDAATDSLRRRIERLGPLWARARDELRERGAVSPSLLAATRLLGRGLEDGAADVALLGSLVDARVEPPLQQAACDALSALSVPEAAAELLDAWAVSSPRARGRIREALLGREGWTLAWLTRARTDESLLRGVDAATAVRLREHPSEAVRAAAAELLAAPPASDRHAVVERFRPALALQGEAARGEAVFRELCASCHALDGFGRPIGPDLAALSDRSGPALLVGVLDPNRAVLTEYEAYAVVTRDGRVETGLITDETATSITLATSDGTRRVLRRAEVLEARASGRSLMPEGLEESLDPQRLADLFAFVGAERRPRKVFAGNQPRVVERAADGSYELAASSASIHGRDIAFELPFTNVGMWHHEGDRTVWTVEIAESAELDVWLEWACARSQAGKRFVLESEGLAVRGVVEATGEGWDRYARRRVGRLRVPAGLRRWTLRSDGPFSGALIDLRAVWLVPAGRAPEARPR